MRPATRAWLLLPCLLVVACGGEPGLVVEELPPPPAEGGQTPELVASGDALLLSWQREVTGGGASLQLARFDGEAWGEPDTVAAGEDWFVNWADFAGVAPFGPGRLLAHWREMAGEGTYAYHIRQRQHDGNAWRPAARLHEDGSATEHGFVATATADDGRLGVVWLDGRKFAEGHGGATGEMTVRFAELSPTGETGPEVELDGRACDCCQTALVPLPDGWLALWRDRSPSEVRDIVASRYHEGEWSAPMRVRDDGWRIAGCPVNGPAADARGDRVVVAWYSEAHQEPRVRVAFSAERPELFGRSTVVDEGDPLGRVDVEWIDEHSAAVLWLEGDRLLLRRVWDDGRRGPALALARSSRARSSGFPRLARLGDRLYVAWTRPGDGGGIGMVAVGLPGG